MDMTGRSLQTQTRLVARKTVASNSRLRETPRLFHLALRALRKSPRHQSSINDEMWRDLRGDGNLRASGGVQHAQSMGRCRGRSGLRSRSVRLWWQQWKHVHVQLCGEFWPLLGMDNQPVPYLSATEPAPDRVYHQQSPGHLRDRSELTKLEPRRDLHREQRPSKQRDLQN